MHMQVEINTWDTPIIDWGADGVNAVVQNVFNLVNTMKYEVAYDRTMGIDQDFQDAPLPESIALVTAQIYAVVGQREPRATVQEVTYTGLSIEGNMNFKVVIEV